MASEILNSVELKAIASYLDDPFSYGLWRMRGRSSSQPDFCKYIWDEILREIKKSDYIEIESGKRVRRIRVTESWLENTRSLIFDSLSFTFTIFSYLVDDDDDDVIVAENTDSYSSTHESIELIISLIELGEVKKYYKEAFEYFKNEIWFNGFEPMIYSEKLFRFKAGGVICLDGTYSDPDSYLTLISWSGEPLKKLLIFFKLLGRFDDSSLMPIYSPEEEVFEPYFNLLEISYRDIVKQKHLKPLFEKSISQFKDNNYSDCVSAIGLIAEDLLTQVYETFFRTQLNKGLTLGQLTDEITARVSLLFDKKVEPPPSFAGLYDEIKMALETDEPKDLAALEKIRSLLTMVIANDKYINKKIDSIGKPKPKNSIFTDRVLFSINELVRFRNASSHKSRIPIGPYEATRSLYSLMIFLMWWDNEKSNINWDSSAEEIIRETVYRNSNK